MTKDQHVIGLENLLGDLPERLERELVGMSNESLNDLRLLIVQALVDAEGTFAKDPM